MNTTIAALLATTMIAAPLAIAGDGFPGLPDQAAYGQCMGYTHADANATANATAFRNHTAEEACEDLEPEPQDDRADEHRPASAGEDRDPGGHDDARQDDAAREDGRAYGQSQADEHRPADHGQP